jgi:hypothetical protein
LFRARRDPTVLLEPVDQSLDLLSHPIDRSIKGPATMFIGFMRDRAADTMTPHIGSDFAAALGFVTNEATRPTLRSSSATAFHRTSGH